MLRLSRPSRTARRARTGDAIEFAGPAGQLYNVFVPPDTQPGQVFNVSVGAAPVATADDPSEWGGTWREHYADVLATHNRFQLLQKTRPCQIGSGIVRGGCSRRIQQKMRQLFAAPLQLLERCILLTRALQDRI